MNKTLTARAARCRVDTFAHRCRAVERVIRAMRERLIESFSLELMARVALLSPYHFNRVFRQVTGIPPIQFLWALRLEEAKRLLLTTARSVTDVCFDVGYSSLGTFISRFTKLVGESPRHLRRLRDTETPVLWETVAIGPTIYTDGAWSGVCGRVTGPVPFQGWVAVGLFHTPIPQGRPVGCAIINGIGAYQIRLVPDGVYHVFAVALPPDLGTRASVLYENAWRGGTGPLVVCEGNVTGPTSVTLRPPRATDPPILVALPFLARGISSRVPVAAEDERGAGVP